MRERVSVCTQMFMFSSYTFYPIRLDSSERVVECGEPAHGDSSEKKLGKFFSRNF